MMFWPDMTAARSEFRHLYFGGVTTTFYTLSSCCRRLGVGSAAAGRSPCRCRSRRPPCWV